MSALARLLGVAADSGILVEPLQVSTDAVDRTSYTFSSVNLGAAAADREIFVLSIGGTSVSRTLNSATIAGVSATLASQLNNSSVLRVFHAAVPSGTSGNIVLNYSLLMSNCQIFVYRVTRRPVIGAAQTDFDSGSVASGTSISLSALTIPAGGFGLMGLAITSNTDTFSITSGPFVIDNQPITDTSRKMLASAPVQSGAVTPTNTAAWTNSAAARMAAWAFA